MPVLLHRVHTPGEAQGLPQSVCGFSSLSLLCCLRKRPGRSQEETSEKLIFPFGCPKIAATLWGAPTPTPTAAHRPENAWAPFYGRDTVQNPPRDSEDLL